MRLTESLGTVTIDSVVRCVCNCALVALRPDYPGLVSTVFCSVFGFGRKTAQSISKTVSFDDCI